MSHYLVTGGAGFLGSNLTRRLLREGHAVTAIDDLSTGHRRNLIDHERLEFVVHDVREPFHATVDGIFHLACPASPPRYQADAIGTTLTAVLGTVNALRLATTLGVPVVIASTSEIYGDPEVHPQTEDYVGHVNPIGPRACYDEGKRCAESLAMDFQRQHGTQVRIARIFNTYGPAMDPDDGRVVSNFITQALREEPLTIYGDGSQTRSFCYVDDLIDGLTGLMALEALDGPVNLGNPTENTILELVQALEHVIGRRLTVEHRPLPVDDPTRRRPDISRARRLLGFHPKTDLESGLRHTVAHFAQLLSEVP